ncbi:MAG: ABC transporter ATP-binding protein [bacterium]
MVLGDLDENIKKWSFRETVKAWKNMPFMLGMMFRASPWAAMSIVFFQVLWGVVPALEVWYGKKLFDAVQLSLSGTPADVRTPLFVILGLLVLNRFTLALNDLIDTRFRTMCNLLIHKEVMLRSMSVDLATRESAEFQNLNEKVANHSWRITQIAAAMGGFLGDIVTVISLVVTLISFSPLFVILFALIKFVQATLTGIVNQISWRLVEGNNEKSRRSRMIFSMSVSKEAAKEVRTFSLGRELIARYEKLVMELLSADTWALRLAASAVFVVDFISVCLYGVVYLKIIDGVLAHTQTLGDMALYSGGFLRLEGSMRSLAWASKAIDDGLRYYGSIRELMEYKLPEQSQKGKKLELGPLTIKFENVGFKYKTANKWALRHVDFELNPSETLGLVGENGAGKTTFIKLLTHLYEPTEGKIFVNGLDYRKYNRESLRRAVSVVFQDYASYELSASDNISFGDIQRGIVDSEIKDAAVLSGVAQVIERLPNQYDTVLSTGWSKGAELSGGEWQKVALARALYRADASLVVLDEPTSAFDARAEFKFFQEFLRAAREKEKSAVIVSHRFSNIRIADRVVVLKNGKVEEAGTHEELLAKNGMYAELYAIQKDSLA